MNKLNKPVAEIKCHEDLSLSVVSVREGFSLGRHPVYSQEYVSALLADNEHLARELVARNGEIEGLRKRAAELEAKLATPVRLSRRYETAGYCIDEHYCQEAADGDYLDRDELIASLREQGFTVEGDE